MGLREIGRSIRNELAVYKEIARHPQTPRLAKWLLVAAVAYILSPIDLIPDFIPILGHVDDVLIVPGLIWLALRIVPDHVKEEARQRVQAGVPPDGTG